MSSWEGNLPLVSICSTAFNHELYIEDALNGFLIQKTNFPFEILIHDDASTDNTQEIIRKYYEKYPNIIKPIFQKINQYSQGKRVNFTFNYSRARGKYIALCEGDDYWTDENKLQKQVDIMEKYQDITLCVHATGVYRFVNNNVELKKIKLGDGDKFVSASEVILGGGEYGHTSSFVFRKELIIDPPKWYTTYPSGDTPTRLLAASKGKIYYIDEEMSVYRQGVGGSWTGRMKDNERYINHWNKAINMFNEYDEYTGYKYTNAIKKRKSRIAYQILDRLDTKQNYYYNYYSLLAGSEKLKFVLKSKFPFLFKFLKELKS